jgi:hypothetical protein
MKLASDICRCAIAELVEELEKLKAKQEKTERALGLAVKALYYDDNTDYYHYLWKIVEVLGGVEAVNLLDDDSQKAYNKYVKKKRIDTLVKDVK